MQLFQELQRRNVVRVAIGYIVSSWLLAQVADLVLENISAPDWVMQTILLVLGLGFPVVVFFSWAYEVTPEGIKRESEIDRTQSVTQVTGRKLDRAIVAVLIVALAYFAFDKFVLDASRDAALVESITLAVTEQAATEQAASEQVATEEASAESDKSIAVLPFVNMSNDPDQEFFSDGMTEEILNVLAKNRSLRVAGRTSSFAYKGQNQDLRVIGQNLGVQYLVEGSIRKAGDTVRITAQVIQASDGFHIWSETYDRELIDIFAVQDEIARAVSDALEVSFGLSEGESLIANTTNNMAAYDLYLKAKEAHKYRRIPEALGYAQQVVEMEPDFAPGWAIYAQVQSLMPDYVYFDDPIECGASYGRAEKAAQKALIIDPNSIDALGALGNAYRSRLQWGLAEKAYLRALEIDPDSPVIMEDYAELLIAVGKTKGAMAVSERLLELETKVAIYFNLRANALAAAGDHEGAVEAADQMFDLDSKNYVLAQNYLSILVSAGEYEKGREILTMFPDLEEEDLASWEAGFQFSESGLESLTPSQREITMDDLVLLALSGQKDLLFQRLSRDVKLGWWGDFFTFNPEMQAYMGTPQFKNHMQELNLVAYWHQNGWPDMCRPEGDENFICE